MAGASKSKIVEFDSNELKTKEHGEYFFKGKNGNDEIDYLNNYSRHAGKDDRIRREQNGPSIFCLGLNTNKSSNPMLKEPGKILCKIGFSHLEAKPEHDSRISEVKRLIPDELKVKPTVIFNMPMGHTDVRKVTEVKTSISGQLGSKFANDEAKDLHLPTPTDWIWIEDKNIKEVKDKIDIYKEDNVLSTRMFKDLKLS